MSGRRRSQAAGQWCLPIVTLRAAVMARTTARAVTSAASVARNTRSLIVSGGHTELILMHDHCRYQYLGSTLDDAAGEAFDKIARALGLGYPGGPLLDKLAASGNREAIDFPRAFLEEGSYDFSFSGLKSAVLNYLNSKRMKNEEVNPADVAASFQEAVTDVLSAKLIKAALDKKSEYAVLAGGVASNSRLRELLKQRGEQAGIKVIYPSPVLCTDNAAMIGCAAYYRYINGSRSDFTLNAMPNLSLE